MKLPHKGLKLRRIYYPRNSKLMYVTEPHWCPIGAVIYNSTTGYAVHVVGHVQEPSGEWGLQVELGKPDENYQHFLTHHGGLMETTWWSPQDTVHLIGTIPVRVPPEIAEGRAVLKRIDGKLATS